MDTLTTTSTAWVEVEGAELAIPVMGRHALATVAFYGMVTAPHNAYFSIVVDDDAPLELLGSVARSFEPHSLIADFDELSPGNHTFRLLWRVNGGTATIALETLGFMAKEVEHA